MRYKQPQNGPIRLDRNNPLTRGLLAFVIPGVGAYDSARDGSLVKLGAPLTVASNDGIAGLLVRANNDGYSLGADSKFNPQEYTLFTIANTGSLAVNNGFTLLAKDDDLLGRAYVLDVNSNPGWGARFYVNGGGNVGPNEIRENVDATSNTRYVLAATTSGSIARLYRDGKEVNASPSFALTNTATGDAQVGRRTYAGNIDGWEGNIVVSGMWSRALSASEIASISANPWQLFEPANDDIFIVAAASGTTGTLAKTNANDTVSASGTTTVTGTVSKTNASDASAATGTTTVKGTVNKANANDAVSASGSTTVLGTLARTNANDSVSASGSVGSTITGTLNKANASDSVSAAGTTTVVGTLAKTNVNDTVSASGSVGSNITGTVNTTNATDSINAAGTTTVAGTVAKTNANDTVSASGTTTVTGTVVKVNANDGLSASGTTTVAGSLAKANANDSVAASGVTGAITGTVNTTNANDSASAGVVASISDGGRSSQKKPRWDVYVDGYESPDEILYKAQQLYKQAQKKAPRKQAYKTPAPVAEIAASPYQWVEYLDAAAANLVKQHDKQALRRLTAKAAQSITLNTETMKRLEQHQQQQQHESELLLLLMAA